MKQYLVALRFSLREQLDNKFAFGLLVVFVPIWYWMLGAITPSNDVAFKFQATHEFIQVNSHDLVLLTAGLNVSTMILGFMFYQSSHRSIEFDKRLTRAGLNPLRFMQSKITTLLVVTAAVSLYTVGALILFWHFPKNIFELLISFWLVSLIYAALGLALGMLLTSELAGFFLILMVSMMDTFLQNPIGNPAANKGFLVFFPSHASTQLGVAGGFTHLFPLGEIYPGICWFAGLLLFGLGTFYMRTRRKGVLTVVAPLDQTRMAPAEVKS